MEGYLPGLTVPGVATGFVVVVDPVVVVVAVAVVVVVVVTNGQEGKKIIYKVCVLVKWPEHLQIPK